jgi:hypothetical protein
LTSSLCEDFERRVDAREFLPVERDEHEPGRAFTTPPTRAGPRHALAMRVAHAIVATN